MGVKHVPPSAIPTDRSAIETDQFTSTVGRFDAPAGPAADWHHHGGHHVVAYLISWKVRIESGPEGAVITDPSPGDLVHIEPQTVHRETYEGEVAIVGFTVGSGPGRVDVAGPETSG